MVQVLLIILFATPHLYDMLGGEPALKLAPGAAVGLVLGPLLLMWGVFQALCVRWGRRLDRTGHIGVIRSAEHTMLGLRLVAIALWGFGLFGLGSLSEVRGVLGDVVLIDELVTILPVLLFVTATWWSLYPLDLRLREALLMRTLDNPAGFPVHPPLTRAQYIASGLRHQIMLFFIPLSLMTAWQETCGLHLGPWLDRSHGGLAPTLLPVLEYAGIIAVLVLSPAIMRRVWDTVPIEGGALRDQVRAMCRRYGVRVRGPLLWRTHGSIVNGAILGVFWPLRYMLLTDALLERLTADQVEAVMAHEVAHVRRRHLIWLAVCVLSTVVLSFWVLKGVLDGLPGTLSHHPGMISVVMALGGLAGAGTVFGLVSRRFEWQADAFAVQHITRTRAGEGKLVTPDAVAAMAGALQSVADLNGIDPDAFTWRHGSVSERQRRLRALLHRPIDAFPIDRQVTVIKLAAIVTLVATTVPIIWQAVGGVS
jgi:STE24 endopeptidase